MKNWIELLQARYQELEGLLCELDKARIAAEIKRDGLQAFYKQTLIYKACALTLVSCDSNDVCKELSNVRCRWRCLYLATLQLKMLLQWADKMALVAVAANECELQSCLKPIHALAHILVSSEPNKVKVLT